jgi:regulator of protease activity HflC (stomatin/prohibitin superfamily)
MSAWVTVLIVLIVLALMFVATMMVRVLQEYERAVVFRLGRVVRRAKGPGILDFIKDWPVQRHDSADRQYLVFGEGSNRPTTSGIAQRLGARRDRGWP